MSTKIYDAYKFSGSVTQLMPRLLVFRKRACEILKAFMSESVTFQGERDVWFWMDEAERQVRRNGYTELNISCSIVVYTRSKINGTLFQMFGVPKEISALMDWDDCADWHYQNSADKPEEITSREWTKRRKEWDIVFSKTTTPSEAGLVFEIANEHTARKLVYEIACERAAERAKAKQPE